MADGRVIGLPGRDDEPTASPEHAPPALPATVAATHFTASAAALAGDAVIGDLADLTAVLDQLVTGQEYIAATLARLAEHIADRHRDGALGMVDSPDIAALTEVINAAATATGHAAGALAQSKPVLDIVLAAAGPDASI